MEKKAGLEENDEGPSLGHLAAAAARKAGEWWNEPGHSTESPLLYY